MTRPTAPGSLATMGRGTLSRRLVLRTSALVALAAVLLSLLTAVATFGILQAQLDETLMATAGRLGDDGVRGGDYPDPRPDDPGTAGQRMGLILLRVEEFPGYTLVTAFVQTEDGREGLTEADAELLAAVEPGAPSTVRLELGVYRVLAVERPDGTAVTGLPLAEVSRTMTKLLLAEGVLTMGAIALSSYATRQVVARSLRPLSRLATTATQVSRLELDSGEVAVPVRVPTEDTDPRSEVGQVGIAFNHMLDNVEGALAARQRSETKVRQFVADASHELRNPLASIRGYAELTRHGRDELPAETRHALARIESESERMSHLVEDLLLLARLDADPKLELRPTNVNDIVVNAVSDAQVAGPDHVWSVSLPEQDVVARADGLRLHQVVVNLLANARTHTPPGTSVETALSSEDGYAVVRVTDDGPGIPTGLTDRVFERFVRADAARSRSGKGTSSTGLGLAIVAAVVAAHGGTAAVTSSAGRTTFSVRVPLA